MTNAQIAERTQTALLDFVERVSKKSATAEEVEALPVVSRVLLDSIGYGG